MRVRWSVLLGLWLCVLQPVHALTVLPATFDELVRESTAVVYGRVQTVQGRWTADRRTIESVVTLEALDHYKGSDTATTTFVVPGGEAGGRVLFIPGAPSFRPGDAVVVFLRGAAPAMPTPVGLSLGVYRVVSAGTSGAIVIPTPISVAAGEGAIRRGTPDRAPRPLERFAADVRAVGPAR